jgi:predicted helicase
MLANLKGTVVMPTGAGKTLSMITDVKNAFQANDGAKTIIVIVAPRILLAEQLCSEFLEQIDDVSVMHVHSGETHHFSSTKPNIIHGWSEQANSKQLIFTTYHSLHRIQEADLKVHTIHFDESHNSVKKNFFPATEHFSATADRCYFHTATPVHSATTEKPGMNDAEVYGNVICKVPAPELVQGGFIVPPKVSVRQIDIVCSNVFERDCKHLLDTIDGEGISKGLICAKSTKQIVGLMSNTSFYEEMQERGYSVLYITSKTGAMIDGKKVNREVFFDTLNAWGKDNAKKFIVLHHSIISEGINVSGLEAVVFMRTMNYIGILQSVGRTLRLHHEDAADMRSGAIPAGQYQLYRKPFGKVVIPTYDKVGISTAKKVQNALDIVFQQGGVCETVIKR